MDDDLVRRGGRIGFAIAFLPMLVLLLPTMLCAGVFNHQSISLGPMTCLFFTGLLVSAGVGLPLGQAAATYPTVNAAFVRPAVVTAAIGLVGIAIVIGFMIWHREVYDIGLWLVFWLTAITAAIVSIHSGLTAIYLRDYRQFGRARLIPQFTLQELLIVLTLFACIISAAKSVTLFPL
jgi:hypothetical protein